MHHERMPSSPSSQSNNNRRCNDGKSSINYSDFTTSTSCSDGLGCNRKLEEAAKHSITDSDISRSEARVRDYLNSFFQPITPQDRTVEHSRDVGTKENRLPAITTEDDESKKISDRVECCGSSQSLYCKFCCRLLVPDELLPPPISLRKRLEVNCLGRDLGYNLENMYDDENKHGVKDGREVEHPLRIPFDLHIILDDRRGGSTGLHAVALLNERFGKHSVEAKTNTIQEMISLDGNKRKRCETKTIGTKSFSTEGMPFIEFSNVAISHDRRLGSIALIDVKGGDAIPDYHSQSNRAHIKSDSSTTNMDDNSTTFLLFPSPGESVPIKSIADKIKTLVVLDCKWTRSHLSKSRELSCLQKVSTVHSTRITFLSPKIYFHKPRWGVYVFSL